MIPSPFSPSIFTGVSSLRLLLLQKQQGSIMGTRLVLLCVFAVLLSVSSGAAASKTEAAPPVVVGSVKCLDCSSNDVKAEDAFEGLQVAINCKTGAGETYETKTLGHLDDTGAFRIPLAANLLRDDGELDRDCFAQLHSAPDTPCAGQAPPRIAPAGPNNQDGATYLAIADDTEFSPVACKCGKFKKKHFMFSRPPPPRPPAPEYKPPTPTPVPTPSYGPPTPKPPAPPAEDDKPEPFFHKHPKMKFMHKKKPCPPLVDEDKPQPKN